MRAHAYLSYEVFMPELTQQTLSVIDQAERAQRLPWTNDFAMMMPRVTILFNAENNSRSALPAQDGLAHAGSEILRQGCKGSGEVLFYIRPWAPAVSPKGVAETGLAVTSLSPKEMKGRRLRRQQMTWTSADSNFRRLHANGESAPGLISRASPEFGFS